MKKLVEQAPELWERQPNETGRSYAAFMVYRDLSPARRTFTKLARSLNRDVASIESLAQANDWVARAAAWDEEKARLRAEEDAAGIEDMTKRHIDIGMMMQDKGAVRIKRISTFEAERLPLVAAMRMLEQGIKTERTARGVEAAPAAANVSVNVTAMQSLDMARFGTAAPVAQFLRDNPDRVGPVIGALEQLIRETGGGIVTVEGLATAIEESGMEPMPDDWDGEDSPRP
jgi:hypothetical protein